MKQASRCVVALDIGHSAVKAVVSSDKGVGRVFFPSLVCQARLISDEVEANLAAQETVRVGGDQGASYFFGETALIQGGGKISGLSDNWISTREHAALLLGAMKKISTIADIGDRPTLVMGLPARLFGAQREELEQVVRTHLPNIGELVIVSQASAPLYTVTLDESGIPIPGRSRHASWGVIEVGFYTTDFMLTKRGRRLEVGAEGCSGLRVAAEYMKTLLAERHRLSVSLIEAAEAHENRSIQVFGQLQALDTEAAIATERVSSEIIDTANRLMEEHARSLDGILVAGGGAPIVFDKLKAQWPNAVMADDHRFAVAEGMLRRGLALNVMAEQGA